MAELTRAELRRKREIMEMCGERTHRLPPTPFKLTMLHMWIELETPVRLVRFVVYRALLIFHLLRQILCSSTLRTTFSIPAIVPTLSKTLTSAHAHTRPAEHPILSRSPSWFSASSPAP
eukprot:8425-Hanusia_phi.AAC.4